MQVFAFLLFFWSVVIFVMCVAYIENDLVKLQRMATLFVPGLLGEILQ